MIYWILAIIVAVVLGYNGYCEGFRRAWVRLFNVLVSIYISVMGTRAICRLAPGIEEYQYYKAGMVIVFGIIFYLLLWVVAYFFAKDDYIDSLPNAFENYGGAALGVFTGFALTGFALFSIFIFTAKIEAVPDIVVNQIAKPSSKSVGRSCGVVSGFSLQTTRAECEIPETINWLTANKFVKADVNCVEDEVSVEDANDF